MGTSTSPACSSASTPSRASAGCASRPRTPSTSTTDGRALCASCERLCPYLHLPFQSGSNRILASMRRGYTREEYLAIVDRLRETRPDLALSTDVIVGYPGETEAEFEATLASSSASVSTACSPSRTRPGRARPRLAWRTTSPEAEKSRRFQVLNARQQQRQRRRNDALVGQTARGPRRVGSTPPGRVSGRTPHFRIVHLDGPASWSAAPSRSEITGAGPNALQGRLSQNVH